MRISDWSSDVCSSDLDIHARDVGQREARHQTRALTLQEVEAVEGSSADSDHDLEGPRLRIGQLNELDDLGTAVAMVDRRSHVMPRTNGLASASGRRLRLAKKQRASRAAT